MHFLVSFSCGRTAILITFNITLFLKKVKMKSALTSVLEVFIPHRPHLHREKRRPANNVRQNDYKGHFYGPQFGSWYGRNAADRNLPNQPVFTRSTRDSFPFLVFDIFPYAVADEPVAHHEHDHGHEEDPHGYPGDVRLGAPGLQKVRPAVVHVGAVLDLAQGEDEILRSAEHQAAHPRGDDHDVGALGGLLESFQRVADGDVTVHGHHHHHIGWRKHPHHLKVLDYPAQKVWAIKTEGDLPT